MTMNIAYNMDCMEYMKALPDKAVDLCLADPPYFSGPERRGFYGCKISKIGVHREYPISPCWKVPGRELFEEIQRVSKKWIVWGCNYFRFSFPPGRIIWDKCNGLSSFSDCEIAATNCHESVRLFRFMWSGMLQGKNVAEGHIMQGDKKLNEIRIHPTQKPVALYEWLLAHYARAGDKILDTHLGSGSSRIAAYDAGLDFVGCEIEKHYFEVQEERFLAHAAQENLFLQIEMKEAQP